MVLAAGRRAVVERGPISMVRWSPTEKESRRETGPQQEGTAEALGEYESLGCTQPH